MNGKHNNAVYKKELITLLSKVDKALVESGIEYFGVYGTCLGAVRENNIIPWDDDIDIAVRRCDFKRVIEVLSMPKYQTFAGDRTNVPGCPSRCGRVFNRISNVSSIEQRRAYIDIHVIDAAPTNSLMFYWSVLWHVGITRIISRRKGTVINNHKAMYIIADILALPFRLFTSSFLYRFSDWIYIYNRSSPVVKLTFDGNRKRYESKIFSKSIRMSFGSITLPVPIGYEEFLTKCYGNWRVPPPKEGRYSHAYDRDGVVWTVPTPEDIQRLII